MTYFGRCVRNAHQPRHCVIDVVWSQNNPSIIHYVSKGPRGDGMTQLSPFTWNDKSHVSCFERHFKIFGGKYIGQISKWLLSNVQNKQEGVYLKEGIVGTGWESVWYVQTGSRHTPTLEYVGYLFYDWYVGSHIYNTITEQIVCIPPYDVCILFGILNFFHPSIPHVEGRFLEVKNPKNINPKGVFHPNFFWKFNNF